MKRTLTKETTDKVTELIETALENGWSEEDLCHLVMKGPKEHVVDVTLEVVGVEQLSKKLEKAADLLNEANAILNDVAKDTGVEVIAKSSISK